MLWLGATRSAAVRDSSLHLRVSLDIVGFTVTLAINLNRARLDRALILSALDIGSLFNLIVTATQTLIAHLGVTAGHLAGWAVGRIKSASALFCLVVSNTQASSSYGRIAMLN
jgi:hypothetical protein